MSIFSSIKNFFTSGKAKAVAATLQAAIATAAPIVADIALIVPNRTTTEIATAYAKYGVPLSQVNFDNPQLASIALRDLAVEVLKKNHAGVAAQTLTAAVEVALAAFRANQ